MKAEKKAIDPIMKKIMKARSGLILDAPFFAALALKLKVIKAPRVPTMGVDGVHLFYNEQFVNELPPAELKGVICHEAMHCASCHHVRRGKRDPLLWNIAADYAINPIILDANFKLPKAALFDSKFKGKSTEAIYEIVRDDTVNRQKQSQNGQSQNGNGTATQGQSESQTEGAKPKNGNGTTTQAKSSVGDVGGCGEVLDCPSKKGKNAKPNATDKMKQEQEWKIALQQAAQTAKSQGSLPAGIDRMVTSVCETKVNWKDVLARFVVHAYQDDFTWKRPNPRYVYHNLYLPSLHNEKLGDVVLAVDTSGSISRKEINEFAAEIQGIISDFNGVELLVIYCDSEVAGTEIVTSDDVPLNLNPKGGGGTDYIPVFDYLEKECINPIALIYFTDGYCDRFPDEEPDCETLWALNNENSYFKAPFGEVLPIIPKR